MLGPLREFFRPSGVVNVVAWFVVGAGILDVVVVVVDSEEGGEGRFRDDDEAETEAGDAGDMLVCIASGDNDDNDDDDYDGCPPCVLVGGALVLREDMRERWAADVGGCVT